MTQRDNKKSRRPKPKKENTKSLGDVVGKVTVSGLEGPHITGKPAVNEPEGP